MKFTLPVLPSGVAWLRLLGATLLAAGLLVLALPPYDLWPLALCCLLPLYLATRQLSPRQAAAWGGLFGLLVHLLTQTWWLAVFTGYAQASPSLSMGLFLGLCVYQALVFALWAGLCQWLERRWRLSWLVSAPLLLVLLESVWPTLFFPYYLGIAVWRAWPLLQIAELGGPTAVSALLVLGNLTLAEGVRAWRAGRAPGRGLQVSAGLLGLALLLGTARGLQVAAVRASAPTLTVGILQPNFGILTVAERDRHGTRYLDTLRRGTAELGQQGAELVFWAESAWPYLLDRGLTQEFPPGHPWELRPGYTGRLLTGMLSHDFGVNAAVYNSAVLYTANGAIAGRYDKRLLVPFAEQIPLAARFPEQAQALRDRMHDFPQITPGPEPTLLIDGDLRLGVVICSEDLEAGYVQRLARQQPNLLAALVSDSWFGASAAPRLHLALSVLRAVETRRDFVRSTNTGVSAIVDAVGRVQLEGPLYGLPPDQPAAQPTLLVGTVALLDMSAAAPYTAQYFPYLCLLGLLGGAFAAARQQPPRTPHARGRRA